MMPRTTVEYLEDIVQEARRAVEFLGEMSLEQLEADDKTAFAIERALEIIGEASSHVPKDLQTRYPNVAWSGMIGMRIILAQQVSGRRPNDHLEHGRTRSDAAD